MLAKRAYTKYCYNANVMDAKKNLQLFTEKFKSDSRKINTSNIYKPRAGDIIISGPHKTGTTWLQQILHQIRTKGDESFKDIYDVTWFIQLRKLADVFNFNNEQVCSPRIYKCHLSYDRVPKGEGVKYVITVRNPYDIVYSYQKFLHRYMGINEDVDEKSMITYMKSDWAVIGESCMLFYTSWWHHRLDSNVFWIHYEDLLQNSELIIKQLAAFIEAPLTKEELKRVCSLCTFDYMSAHAEKFNGDHVAELMALSMHKEKWHVGNNMVRADGGKSGQGVENLGSNLKKFTKDLWDEIIAKQLGFTNYGEMYAVGSRLNKNIARL